MNTYMKEKGHIIFTKEFQLINVEGTRRINKSPLAHHGSNCCKQILQLNAKINGWEMLRNKVFA